jgi:uncharacterized protein RhaS with RHS repeats
VLQGHRYYDPSTGTWLTRDPIGYAGGINLYAFCGNNPVNWSDPSGFGSLYRWIYTGDWNASDDVYDAAITASGDWFYDHSPVRGAYISYGLQGGPRSINPIQVYGNAQVGWTVDDGFGAAVSAGVCTASIANKGGSYGCSQDSSWQGGFNLGRGAAQFGVNPITGGNVTYTLGTWAPGFGFGVFIDPTKLFSGEYWR